MADGRIKAELKIYEAKAHNVKQRARMISLWKQFAENNSKGDISHKIYRQLRKLYSEPHRFYHNLGHVNFLLGLFEEFRGLIEDEASVYFAIWFHDAIYDPQRKDNEKRSAELAAGCLRRLNMSADGISKTEKIILATEKHSAEKLDADGRLFLDFDLAILGAGRDAYARYAREIRREYNFISADVYQAGRRGVLQNFCRRDFIYLTDPMRERFEDRARRNIVWEMERL